MRKIKKILSVLLCILLLNYLPTMAFSSSVAYAGTCGVGVRWSYKDETRILTISGNGEMNNFSSTRQPWNGHVETMESVVIEPGVLTIGNNAFINYGTIKNIVIPDTVESIGESAILNCDSLEYIHYIGSEEDWTELYYASVPQNESIDQADVHFCEYKEATVPTCQRVGHEAGWYCDICDSYFVNGQEIAIDPENHEFEENNGICCGIYEQPVLNSDDYYEIHNLGTFAWFAQQFNNGSLGSSAKAILTDDIDLSGFDWVPIGKSSRKYFGIFDGQNHSIAGFQLNITGSGYYGLFGFVAGGSTEIKNFSISGNTTTALTSKVDTWYGLVGQMDGGGLISNVHSSINYTAGDTYYKKFVGGLVGQTGDINIEKSSFSGNIELGASPVDCVGGIAAYSYNGKIVSINNCAFYGSINSDYTDGSSQIGGIIGYYNAENGRNLKITNCLTMNEIFLDGATDKAGSVIGVLKSYSGTQSAASMTNNYYADSDNTLSSCGTGNYKAIFALDSDLREGATAYLLQSANTEQVWGQDIDNGKTRQYLPHINGGKLYQVPTCLSETGYSNVSTTNGHHYVDYKCLICRQYPRPKSDGTYYLISNPGELFWISSFVGNGNPPDYMIKLVADIDINPGYVFNDDGTVLYDGEVVTDGWVEWKSIGNSQYAFNNYFYGDNHTISGIYVNSESDCVGLFGISNGAKICDITLENSYIKGNDSVGGICGYSYESDITNCTNKAFVHGNRYVGGICGQAKKVNILKCINEGNVTANTYSGGICGYAGMYVGAESYSNYITNCYNTGKISGNDNIGGISGIGIINVIDHCFNVGEITAVGSSYGPIITSYSTSLLYNVNNYYLAESDNGEGGKTAEQFASGEVAYLLQNGNIEQVWGQDNNRPGAMPVFTSNELYRAVKIGETGIYAVANMGDTNNDGIVDISDYQMLANSVVSGGHAQSETQSYNDIVRYDLNCDGYVDALDASLMHMLMNGLGIVDVYAVGDYNRNGIAFEATELGLIKHAIENPENLTTDIKYASDINGDGKLDENDLTALTEKYGEITGMDCAGNAKVYYRWSNNNATCTATVMCTLCGEKLVTETVDVTIENLSELTCTQDKVVKYTATFQNEAFEEIVKTITTDMLHHDFIENKDNLDGTHTGVCDRCGYIEENVAHHYDESGTCVCGAFITLVSTFEELKTAISQGGEYVLTNDIDVSSEVMGLDISTDVTLHLNGKTIIGDMCVFNVCSGATLTILGDGVLTINEPNVGSAVFVDDGTINAENGYVDSISVNQMSICNVNGSRINNIYMNQGATCIVNGGYIEFLHVDDSSCTINGGQIRNMHMYNSTCTVTGGTFDNDPSEYVDTENYDVTFNDDHTWTVTAK